MKKPVLKIILLLGSLLAIALGVALLFPSKPLPPPKPLPNQNGFTIALSAAGTLTNSGDYFTAGPEELKPIVAANSNALQTVRAAFSNEWRVPLSILDPTLSNHLNELSHLKQLAHAFSVEGRLAEIENDPDTAARDYLDSIEVGIRSAHGGVLIDGLVSLAMENIGAKNLQTTVPRLKSSTCREIAQSLEHLDAGREAWPEIMNTEREWSRRAFPGLRYRLQAFFMRRSLATGIKKAGLKFEKQQTELRQLILQLAARAYELDKGEAPKAANDLVPDYLKAIPQNPTTGLELPYP
ncbi:MAG TPA: hypothetical protein VIV82_00835 [Verrucomicrobiae bacterium]|jgi:hypothetical protein